MARKDSNPEQRYACDRPGCSKSYSRPDHLLRHKLNHDVDRVLCCNQCDRTFVRQDLLIRHLERHALRGKTLGRWSNKCKYKHEGGSGKGSGAGPSGSRQRRPSKAPNQDNDQDEDDSDKDDDDNRVPTGTADETNVAQHAVSINASAFANKGSSASGSMSRYQGGAHGYSVLNDSGPSLLAWNNYSSHPLNSPPNQQPGSAQAYPTSKWSPPAQSSSSTTGLSPHPPTAQYSASQAKYRPDGSAETGGMASFSRESGQENRFDAFGKDLAIWNDSTDPLSTRMEGGMAGDSAGAAADTPSFRWMQTDDLTNGGGRRSYAPPPSGTYYAGWPDASSSSVAGDGGQARGDGGAGVAPSTAAGANKSAMLAQKLPVSNNQDIFPFASPAMDHTADYGWLFDGMDPFGSSNFPGLGRLDPGGSRGQLQTYGFSPSSSDGLGGFLGNFSGSQSGHGRHGGAGDNSSFGRGMSSDGLLMSGSEVDTPNALEDLAYFASLQAEIPSKVTYHVDPVAHHRLLIFLQSVGELPNSPLFTPSALRCYIYLYFVKFNRLYPLIHEPTFAASTTDPMLLSAVVVIGAHFAGLPAHEMAVRIAQKIWGAIVSLEDFRPARATLPMLQAMVLTECFGKEMSTRPQHEMAHLFHNFIITLARRNAVFNASAVAQVGYEESGEHWRNWAREEEKKRIALFAFMLDAQHATTFRHIPALSAFQIQLNLPCSDDEWSKTSHETWFQHRKRPSYKPASPFIPALKACLSPGKTPQDLDAFPRLVLLHGLMSIAYDLQWKQNVLLGADTSSTSKGNDAGINNWKDRLSAAYSSLQARMDIAYIKANEDSSAKIIHRATPSLVSAAQITLFADTIDIQIYAGLPSVLGRFIDRFTFNASRRSVKEWARMSDGRTAVWHAVNFLRTSLLGSRTESFGTIQPWKAEAEDENRVMRGEMGGRRASSPDARKSADRETGLDEVLHHRWCQYLCALVIWAYGHAHSAPRGTLVAAGPPRPGVNMPDASMPLQGPYIPKQRPNPTTSSTLKPEGIDFLECMSTRSPEDIVSVDCKCYTRAMLELVEKEVRGSRWELGREASGVLRKLISNHAMPHWDRSAPPPGKNTGKSVKAEENKSGDAALPSNRTRKESTSNPLQSAPVDSRKGASSFTGSPSRENGSALLA